MKRPATDAQLADHAWRRLFAFIILTASQRDRVLARLGLSPGDSRTLTSLDEVVPRTMRSLAQEWGCDPSNATWMVDRLEQRGLVERRGKETDRRVKLVLLTPAGAALKAELLAGLYAPPPELLALSRADLELLSEASERLPGTARPPGSDAR